MTIAESMGMLAIALNVLMILLKQKSSNKKIEELEERVKYLSDLIDKG